MVDFIEQMERGRPPPPRLRAAMGTWHQRAVSGVRQLPEGWIGKSEEFRARLHRNGLEQPKNPKAAWGAVTRECVARGWLVQIGIEAMTNPGSHKRKTPVYRRTAVR